MQVGVLTNATDSNIAHIPCKKRKQIIEKARTGERSQHNESEKSKVGSTSYYFLLYTLVEFFINLAINMINHFLLKLILSENN